MVAGRIRGLRAIPSRYAAVEPAQRIEAQPGKGSEVVARIDELGSAQTDIEGITSVAQKGRVAKPKVVQPTSANAFRTVNLHILDDNVGQRERGKGHVVLVLLKVSAAGNRIDGLRQKPALAQHCREHALVVALRVLVDFVRVAVVVVGGVAALQKVERVCARYAVAHDVVGYAGGISAEPRFRNAPPGLLGALAAREGQQAPGYIVVAVLSPKQVALKGAARAVHEPITAHGGEAAGGGPTFFGAHESAVKSVADARRVERPEVGRDLVACGVVRDAHLKRQGRAKGSAAQGRRAHAALHHQ